VQNRSRIAQPLPTPKTQPCQTQPCLFFSKALFLKRNVSVTFLYFAATINSGVSHIYTSQQHFEAHKTGAMADLEVQTEGDGQGSNARNIVMPRKKLRKLVQMLAYSVHILQSTIELDDQVKQEEYNMETLGLVMKTGSNSAGKVIETDKTANDLELKDEQSTARITVVPQEELVRQKATKFKAFEGQLSPHY
jgi:hypothetical protein